MQKYFVNSENFYNDYQEVIIDKDDSFHIVKVMRMRLNDEVLVSDNMDTYRCSITKLDEKGVILKVLEKLDGNPELKVKVGL